MSGNVMARSLLQAPSSPSVKPPVVFNNTVGQPCILLWADTLLASFQGNEIDLGKDIFNGSSAAPDLTGSVCNETLSRLEQALSSSNQYTFQHRSLLFLKRIKYLFFRLVLNYQSVLSFQSFKLM